VSRCSVWCAVSTPPFSCAVRTSVNGSNGWGCNPLLPLMAFGNRNGIPAGPSYIARRYPCASGRRMPLPYRTALRPSSQSHGTTALPPSADRYWKPGRECGDVHDVGGSARCLVGPPAGNQRRQRRGDAEVVHWNEQPCQQNLRQHDERCGEDGTVGIETAAETARARATAAMPPEQEREPDGSWQRGRGEADSVLQPRPPAASPAR